MTEMTQSVSGIVNLDKLYLEVFMSHDANDPGHGHTIAAWTAVTIIMVATAIGTVFFFLDIPLMVWISVGLALVGLIVGYVLRQMGYGSKPKI